MNNSQLKIKAKKLLKKHFTFFLILFVPYFIYFYLQNFLDFLTVDLDVVYKWLEINNVSTRQTESLLFANDLSSPSLSIFVIGLFSVIISGIAFIAIDAVRGYEDYANPIKKWGTVFSKSTYFLGTIIILILQEIWTLLWMVLFIVPGIVKALAYSQALFIYRDAIDKGQPIGYTEAITKSRELMDGHKAQYFILLLSFIGWWILVILTAGLLVFWVGPYYQLAKANFYNELVKDNVQVPVRLTTK